VRIVARQQIEAESFLILLLKNMAKSVFIVNTPKRTPIEEFVRNV
jgi:hypothetical protein